MKEILGRLLAFGEFQVTPSQAFEVLIDVSMSNPTLKQAQEYAQMHPQMYVINDLEVQENLLDRRRVYEILKVRLEL
eukprot:3615360-Pyramimonas_sp.AAC.1